MWKKAYGEEEVEYVACPLCGADGPSDIATEWSLVVARCTSCGMRYVRRRLKEPDATYKSGTETSALKKYGSIIAGQTDHPRERNYQDTLDRLEPYRGAGRLLDVGPHIGFFMRAATRRGWSALGVEPSPILASLARDRMGLDVRTGYLEEVVLDEPVDAVTFTDVLEHVPNPVAMLEMARDAVRPGGVVLAKVPHGKWNHMKYLTIKRLLSDRVDAYDAREHLLHFTAETLRHAFTRARLDPIDVFVPPPIQAGRPLRRGLRWIAWRVGDLASRLIGAPTFLSPDITMIGKRVE